MQLELEEMYSKYNKWEPIKSYLKNLLEGQDYTKEEFSILVHMMVAKRQPIEALVGIYGEDILSTIDDLINNNCLLYKEGIVITLINIPSNLQVELDTFQYPLPCIDKPYFNNNQDSGYKTWKKNIVLNMKDTTQEVCLSVVENLSQIPLYVNKDIIDLPFNWKGEKKFIDKIKVSIDVMLHSCNEFYITHAYDQRGRIYTNAYHLNYQGIDYQKALIQFANKEKVT